MRLQEKMKGYFRNVFLNGNLVKKYEQLKKEYDVIVTVNEGLRNQYKDLKFELDGLKKYSAALDEIHMDTSMNLTLNAKKEIVKQIKKIYYPGNVNSNQGNIEIKDKGIPNLKENIKQHKTKNKYTRKKDLLADITELRLKVQNVKYENEEVKDDNKILHENIESYSKSEKLSEVIFECEELKKVSIDVKAELINKINFIYHKGNDMPIKNVEVYRLKAELKKDNQKAQSSTTKKQNIISKGKINNSKPTLTR